MKKILVTGSTAYDVLLTYDGSFRHDISHSNLDELSVAFVTSHYARHHGGTGANIAWNLALLKQKPLLVSTVGADGAPYRALLAERGIPVGYIQVIEDQATPTAIIGTDSEEHQITFYHPGADARGTWPDLQDERDDIAYAIISPREGRLMGEGLAWCKKSKIPVFFDPGQWVHIFGPDELRRCIEGATGLIVNAYEWSVLKQKLLCTEEDCCDKYALTLIITRGEQGAMIFDVNGALTIDACMPDHVVNPTGAGDAFRAGLLTGLTRGWSLTDAGRLGCAMGSFAVETEGTLIDVLDIDELRLRAKQAYEEDLPLLTQ